MKSVIILFLFALTFSLKLEGEMLEKLKAGFHREQNLVMKIRLGVILDMEEYLTNDKQYIDSVGLKKALAKICFPTGESFFEDWIAENIHEKISEFVKGLGSTLFSKEEYVQIMLKLTLENLMGKMPYNKIKDLTVEHQDPNMKFDI